MNSNEPMQMGSPPSKGSGFLPQYLLGDSTASSPTKMWSSAPSPLKADSSNFATPGPPGLRSQLRNDRAQVSFDISHREAPQDLNWRESSSRSSVLRSHSLNVADRKNPLLRRPHFPENMQSVGNYDRQPSGNFGNKPDTFYGPSIDASKSFMPRNSSIQHSSPAQIDPFYTQGEDLKIDSELDESWVTVFGFSPAAASMILQQFSQYGTILKHVIINEGNWMHLRYQSKLQARKALSKNGKIFNGSIMIGVMQCIDIPVMFGQSSGEIPGKENISKLIRPLPAAYKSASSQHQVDAIKNPKKSSGVMHALDLMFGWKR